MTKVKIPYYVVKAGKGYFQPTKTLRAIGFEARTLGPDGPAAWAEAWRMYEAIRKPRGAGTTSNEKAYPMNSVGYAWERFRRTDAWANKSFSTRTKDWEWSWQFIEPVFGDVDPSTVQVEDLEEL